MKNLKSHIVCLIFLSLTITSSALAKSVAFDLLAASPNGSWQLREDSDTNHKGTETVNTPTGDFSADKIKGQGSE